MCVCVCVHWGYGSEGSDIVLSAQEEKGMPKSGRLNRMAAGDRSKETERQLRNVEEQRKKSEEHQHLCKQLNVNVGHCVENHNHLRTGSVVSKTRLQFYKQQLRLSHAGRQISLSVIRQLMSSW